MIILEEIFKWHLEAFASELFIYWKLSILEVLVYRWKKVIQLWNDVKVY